jgi:hypothetical protein
LDAFMRFRSPECGEYQTMSFGSNTTRGVSASAEDPDRFGVGDAPESERTGADFAPESGPIHAEADVAPGREQGRPGNMLPGRERRRLGIERILVRLVATCGIVGIGVALGAILVSSSVRGWVTGLVVALVSVVLSAILWSSRQV